MGAIWGGAIWGRALVRRVSRSIWKAAAGETMFLLVLVAAIWGQGWISAGWVWVGWGLGSWGVGAWDAAGVRVSHSTVMAVPVPSLLSMWRQPPERATSSRTTRKPMPRPGPRWSEPVPWRRWVSSEDMPAPASVTVSRRRWPAEVATAWTAMAMRPS